MFFYGSFEYVYAKVSLFFVFFSRYFCPISLKLISKSSTQIFIFGNTASILKTLAVSKIINAI